MKTTVLVLFAALITLVACTKEGVKAGDPCNGPGSCKAPLTCVEIAKGSFCGSSTDLVDMKPGCKDPSLQPTPVSVKGQPAGTYCLPK